ncbi:hypothetical protein V8E36_009471 [Tilletia maclaganii]
MTPMLSVLLALSLPTSILFLLTPLLHRPPFAAAFAHLLNLAPSSLSGSLDPSQLHLALNRLVKLDYVFPGLFPALGFAILAAWLTGSAVGAARTTFLQRGFRGRDLLKPRRAADHFIPETMGLPAACITILLLYVFIPFRYVTPSTFSRSLIDAEAAGAGVGAATRAAAFLRTTRGDAPPSSPSTLLNPRQLAESLGVGIKSIASTMAQHHPYPIDAAATSDDGGWFGDLAGRANLPHHELATFLSACLSLSSATMLGFLDDVFDIRWRYKMPIPIISSVPLLVVYYTGGGGTHVVVPGFLKAVIGGALIDLGPLYYLYISLLSTFCTHSINILAGINGVEVGQAFVISLSLVVNDVLYLDERAGEGGSRSSAELVGRHLFSLSLLIPFLGTCVGLLYWNRYPSRVFIGDTFCYFAGQMLAVAGVLGHFSKTLLLFFLPQIFNFLLSCPQLFGLVYCPRHRVPHVDAETMNLHPSLAVFGAKKAATGTSPISTRIPSPQNEERGGLKAALTSAILHVFEALRLVALVRVPVVEVAAGQDGGNGHDVKRHTAGRTKIIACTNLTLLNAILVFRGVQPRVDLARADELPILAASYGLDVPSPSASASASQQKQAQQKKGGASSSSNGSSAGAVAVLDAEQERKLRSRLRQISVSSARNPGKGRRAPAAAAMSELGLWVHMMGVQVVGSALAFSVRYWLAPVVFPQS